MWTRERERTCGGGGTGGRSTDAGPVMVGSERGGSVLRCSQLLVAELLLLSRAKALLHGRESAEAHFIAAQATAMRNEMRGREGGKAVERQGRVVEGGLLHGGEADSMSRDAVARDFAVQPTICDSPPAMDFTGRGDGRFLRQFIVDGA